MQNYIYKLVINKVKFISKKFERNLFLYVIILLQPILDHNQIFPNKERSFRLIAAFTESPQIFNEERRFQLTVTVRKAPKFSTTKQGNTFPYDGNCTESPPNYQPPRFPCTFRLLQSKRSMLFLFQQSMPYGFFKAFLTDFRVVKANLCTKGNYEKKCGGISVRLLFSIL